MPLALTCDCGARFEVEAALSGQEVSCPECLQALKAPDRPAPPRVSLTALASVVLALVGAFTVVGTLAAVVVGLIALLRIARSRDRLCGVGYAVTGMGAGVLLTVLTVAALWRSDLVPVGGWVRQRLVGGQVDTTGAAEMTAADGGAVLTRPSASWGRVRGDVSDDPAVSDAQKNPDTPIALDLLLTDPIRHAYVDVHRNTRPAGFNLSAYRDELERELNPPRRRLVGDDERGPEKTVLGVVRTRAATVVPPVDGHDGREWVMDLTRGGQRWTFLVRAYARSGPRQPVRILRGYCPSRRFPANEAELRRVMDSVRFP